MLTHYNLCGKVETEILRNYVNRRYFWNYSQPNLPAKYSVQVSQNNMIIKELDTTEHFCFMVGFPRDFE